MPVSVPIKALVFMQLFRSTQIIVMQCGPIDLVAGPRRQ
jgi:hypothetical protein